MYCGAKEQSTGSGALLEYVPVEKVIAPGPQPMVALAKTSVELDEPCSTAALARTTTEANAASSVVGPTLEASPV